MKVIRWLANSFPPFPAPAVATLGNFDGVHLGHQQLLATLCEIASKTGLSPSLISFYPHPVRVLAKLPALPVLTLWRRRLELFEHFGVEQTLLVRFTKEFASQPASLFLQRLYAAQVRHLVIGPYARIGKGREGTPEKIVSEFEKLGGQVTIITPFVVAGVDERISSTGIRAMLAGGDLTGVRRSLGRSYEITGRVVHGKKLGRTIGYPTVNLTISKVQLPPRGVYASRATVEGVPYGAMTNVGLRPTVDDSGTMSVESHLFDFKGDLYGKRISLSFEEKMREELKFDSIEELKTAIAADEIMARKILTAP